MREIGMQRREARLVTRRKPLHAWRTDDRTQRPSARPKCLCFPGSCALKWAACGGDDDALILSSSFQFLQLGLCGSIKTLTRRLICIKRLTLVCAGSHSPGGPTESLMCDSAVLKRPFTSLCSARLSSETVWWIFPSKPSVTHMGGTTWLLFVEQKSYLPGLK